LLQQRLAEVSKLGDFGTKVDAWAADQRSAVRHLESLWQVSSNQMDGLSRAFARDLAAARTELNGQLSAVQGDGVKLAALQEAGSQRASNQMATLLAVVNRERALTAEVEAGRAASEKLLAEFRALEARYNVVSAEAGLATNPPGVNVAVPGVTASVSGREVAVVFEEGLFDHGTHLKLGARDRLLAVAKCLAQPPDPVQIKVVGFADDDRAFLKWTARWEAGLAQERASAVVGYFIGLGLFKPEQLLATSGAATRPFANDTEENRARNRTVVLQVSRSQGLR
jgi:flagellar motor protein MotB